MKKILLASLCILSINVLAQVPSGYLNQRLRFKWIGGIFDSSLHVPLYNGAPVGVRGGAWSKGGMVGVDTTNNKLYFYSGGSWREAGSSGWSLSGNSINAGTDFIGTTNNTSMRFRTNNTVRMVLDSNGNVGIGTSTPQATLHVSGSSGTTLRIVDGNQGANKVLVSDADGDASWATIGSIGVPINNLLAATGSNDINNGNNPQAWRWDSLSSNVGLGLYATTTAASSGSDILLEASVDGANADSVRTTISTQISNSHTGTTSTNIGLKAIAINGTNNYAIIVPSGGGSVGIGASTPDSLLTVELGIRGKRGARFDGLPTFSDTTNYKPVVINSSGTLYKATYWPAGGGGSSGWSLTGNAGTNPASNFIGTTDDQPLSFRVNNTWAGRIYTDGGTYLGIGAGENDNAEDEPNVGVGYYALYYNTTGSANSAVGASALASNTNGNGNSAVGILALYNNTTGYNNSAVGVASFIKETIVRGKLIDSTLSAGSGTKAVRWNSSTGEFTYADTTAGGGSGSGWSLTGNAGTNAATNFIGTTDGQPLMFRYNNQNAGRYMKEMTIHAKYVAQKE